MSIEVKVILEENNMELIIDLMRKWGKVCEDSKNKSSKPIIRNLVEEKSSSFLSKEELKLLGFYNIKTNINGKREASFKQFRYFGLYVKKEYSYANIEDKIIISYVCNYDKAERNISNN